MGFTTLNLNKENFKFSSAHFLIFDENHAEMLHGHNYKVQVAMLVPSEKDYKGLGFHVDFRVFKNAIKASLDLLDEHVLLPKLHPDIKTEIKGESLELRFRDRFYVFPKNEVILLPMTNTSVELLSKYLAETFLAEFKQHGILAVKVSVEETSGQSASYYTSDQPF